MRLLIGERSEQAHIVATSTVLGLSDAILRGNDIDENNLLITEILRQRLLIPDVWLNPRVEGVAPHRLPAFAVDPLEDYLLICPSQSHSHPKVGRYGLHVLVRVPRATIVFLTIGQSSKYVPLPKRLHISFMTATSARP